MSCEIQGCADPAVNGCLAHMSDQDVVDVAGALPPGAVLRCSSKALTAFRARDLLSLGHLVDLSGATVHGDLWLPSAPVPGLVMRGARIEGDFRAVDATISDHVDLQGLEISGGFGWTTTRISGGLAAEGLCLGGGFDLAGVVVAGELRLEGARVQGDVQVQGACEVGGVRWDGLAVKGDVDVLDLMVHGNLSAVGMIVRGSTTLSRSRLDGALTLRRTAFDGDLWLDTLLVHGYVDLSYAVLGAPALLSDLVVTRTVDLGHIRTVGPVRLRLATSQLNLTDAQLASGAELGLREEDPGQAAPTIILTNLSYDGTLTILGLPRLDSLAEQWRLESHGTVEGTVTLADDQGVTAEAESEIERGPLPGPGGVRPRLVSLEGLDASTLVLSRVDLGICRFRRARNLGGLVVDDLRRSLPTSPMTWRWTSRAVVAEEVLWRQSRADRAVHVPRVRGHGTQRAWSRPECGPIAQSSAYHHGDVPPEPQEIAGIYRALRTGQEAAGNQAGAADFYYGEMEMRRRTAARTAADRGERALLWLYWAISGYGLRASRALIGLICLVAGAAAFMHRFGFVDPVSPFGGPQSTVPTDPTGLLSSSSLVYTLGAVSSLIGTEDVALTTAGLWIRAVVRLVGPLLLGLALLALRGRVKR